MNPAEPSATLEQRESADQALFNRIADNYARKDVIASTRMARGEIVRRAMKPVLEAQGSLGVLVDVGCGVGAQADYLKGSYERYLGIDYADGLIDIGRATFAGWENVEFTVANVKEPSLPSEFADTVFVVGALHHMTDLAEVMQALRRLAKPGGYLVAVEPQRGNPIIQGLRRIRMVLDSHYSADQHFFSIPELEEMMNLVPMTDVRVEYQGFLTPPFAQAGMSPQALFRPLSRIACALEPAAEKICFGPLGRLSWNAVAYGRFQ